MQFGAAMFFTDSAMDANDLARALDIGISRVMVRLKFAPGDTLLAAVGRWVALMRQVNG